MKLVVGQVQGVFVPSRKGGCLTGVFESLLWNRLVKLMAKEVSGGSKGHL